MPRRPRKGGLETARRAAGGGERGGSGAEPGRVLPLAAAPGGTRRGRAGSRLQPSPAGSLTLTPAVRAVASELSRPERSLGPSFPHSGCQVQRLSSWGEACFCLATVKNMGGIHLLGLGERSGLDGGVPDPLPCRSPSAPVLGTPSAT